MQNKDFSSTSVFDATSCLFPPWSVWRLRLLVPSACGWDGANFLREHHKWFIHHGWVIHHTIVLSIVLSSTPFPEGLWGWRGYCWYVGGMYCNREFIMHSRCWLMNAYNFKSLPSFLSLKALWVSEKYFKKMFTCFNDEKMRYFILSVTAAVAGFVSLRHPSQKAQSALIG